MKKTLIIVVGFIIFQTGFAQEQPQSFSLQEAINYALENNRTAINAARDIDAAEKQKWETTATGLPQIDASISYTNNIKQQFDAIDFDQDGVVDFGAKQSMNPSVTLNQLLFDGSYIVGLQSAKVFLEISKNAKTKTDLEVRKAVINAYGNVLLANESVEILRRNVSVLEKNLFETEKIFENGLEEEESVEQLQITLSGLKSNLNKTERLQNIALQMLNINLGIDVYNDTLLTDTLETLTVNNINLEILTAETSVENNIDYKIANNDKVSKELLVKLEQSKALPTLSAYLNGAYVGNSDEFTYFDKEQRWIGTSAFGVTLSIPIFSSGMRNASTQRAKINLEKAETDLTETEQRIKLEIASAKSDYQFAIEDYENKKENLALAERIETKNQTKFFEGIGSSFELRQAQTQLYSAQQELLQAMLDVVNSKAELETVLNTPTTN
ncbi:TolC family protein [Winogradskyella psychrotolerans]|uniref:TolC family protein n=1 Tax=Winogradskyella psychrotolerans TaxID=1344585 RepID=UPI001C0763CB|nr:TolC family protein [Winogradskyella psychrotolerans]MBU2927915.1 TolC family protein [Winogradskyella psychrotolerans]